MPIGIEDIDPLAGEAYYWLGDDGRLNIDLRLREPMIGQAQEKA